MITQTKLKMEYNTENVLLLLSRIQDTWTNLTGARRTFRQYDSWDEEFKVASALQEKRDAVKTLEKEWNSLQKTLHELTQELEDSLKQSQSKLEKFQERLANLDGSSQEEYPNEKIIKGHFIAIENINITKYERVLRNIREFHVE